MTKDFAHHLLKPSYEDLDIACGVLVRAFGPHVFLVGSCLTRKSYRDVDVRCILEDNLFAAMFPDDVNNPHASERWRYLSVVISARLTRDTLLPVDFQFQQMTDANRKYKGPRSALGTWTMCR